MIFNHVTSQIEDYYEHHNKEPRYMWMGLDAYKTFIMETSDRERWGSFFTHDGLINRNTRMSFVTKACTAQVNIYAVQDLESDEILISHDKEDLFNFIAERELLCATTGASTADTVTTSEKTDSEE